MDYKQFRKQVDEGKTSPVYLFTGPEKNIRSMMEDRLIEKCVTPGMEAMNVTRVREKNVDPYEILSQLMTLPFLAEKRIVIIEESSGLLSSSDHTVKEAFLSYLKNPSPTSVLIFETEKADKRAKLVKELLKFDQVAFDKLNEPQLRSWIRQRLKRREVLVSDAVIEAVMERSHYLDSDAVSTFSIDTNLEKLADFTGPGGSLTPEDVYEIIPAGIEDNVYKMTDLITTGKTAEAVLLMRRFFEEGQKPIGIFGLIVRQVRILTILSQGLSEGLSQQELGKRAGIPPFVVRKTLPHAKKYERSRLEELMVEAAKTDRALKTGSLDDVLLLELFVLEMAQTKAQGKRV